MKRFGEWMREYSEQLLDIAFAISMLVMSLLCIALIVWMIACVIGVLK